MLYGIDNILYISKNDGLNNSYSIPILLTKDKEVKQLVQGHTATV